MTDEVTEEASECAVCSTDIDVDDVIHTEWNTVVCGDCVMICSRCDQIGSVNDRYHEVDGDSWCDDCTEARAYWCESCEEYNRHGNSFVNDRSESWCEDCLNNAYWCDDCDEWNADGCDRCEEDSNRVIHDYSYRPDAIFHSTDKNERLFFGIEIEVEEGRTTSLCESSEYAYRLEQLDLAYLKHDGSLSNGFEIVTHPMSHDFFKNEATELWTTLETLRTMYKVRSWDTSTCGLHIHISRTGFNNGAHMHRFLNLVYSNQGFYETIAGRSSEQWAKFSDIYRRDYIRRFDGSVIEDDYGSPITENVRTFKHKLSVRSNSDRYSAVNTNNPATLEMRIFRGSVNGATIKAFIDLAHASVEYTRPLTVGELRADAINTENFIRYIFMNQELYPELNTRIDKLMPSVRLNEQNVSV